MHLHVYKCIALSQMLHSQCKVILKWCVCTAGIIMANHFWNHARENMHHIKLCSIMHVCTSILCLYYTFAQQTLYICADDMVYIRCILLVVSPIREGLLLQKLLLLQLQLAIGIIASAIFHRHLFPSQFLCNDLMCVFIDWTCSFFPLLLVLIFRSFAHYYYYYTIFRV